MYWSIREPSVEAKNFCSFCKARLELAKLMPFACMAASFIVSRNAILRSVGTSKGSCSKLLRQVAVTRGAGASSTGVRWKTALARAMATARSVMLSTAAGVTSGLAAKPQAPPTSTRTPKP